jgi:phage tail sheath protein FI
MLNLGEVIGQLLCVPKQHILDVPVLDTQSAATALGSSAKLDEETGWHKALSNGGVDRAMGVSKEVFLDLRDPAADADNLNEFFRRS